VIARSLITRNFQHLNKEDPRLHTALLQILDNLDELNAREVPIVKTITVDFSSSGVSAATFKLSDADIKETSRIHGWLTPYVRGDDAEMDAIVVMPNPRPQGCDFTCHVAVGSQVSGKYYLNYVIF
jgi:hypothetical protein